MMKTVIIGSNGQLGSDITRVMQNDPQFQVFPLTHQDIEISDPVSVGNVFNRFRPDLVINTAAFHQTDMCEDEVSRSFQLNAEAVKILAEKSAEAGSILTHFSTDYVFDGTKSSPYTEGDCPNPISVYGVSKLAGEQILRYIHKKHYVFRVSGLYGITGSRAKGYNFVDIMVKMAREGKDLQVVDDQVLTPTYTMDIAKSLPQILTSEKFGTYHLTNTGECSWFDFTKAILKICQLESTKLIPVKTGHFGEKAVRPAYSVLDNKNLKKQGFEEMPPWQDSLATYLVEKGHLIVD